MSQAIAHCLPIGRGGGQIAVISIKGSGGTLSRNAGEGREGVVVSNNVPEKHRAYARSLRRGMTDAERLVWSKVRAHRLAGLGFRRQVPMLGFIADFVCHDARLVVELDGGQHTLEDHRRLDERRDGIFETAGFRVLRFFNPEVFGGLDDVVETIYRAAMEQLPDHPDNHTGGGTPPSLPSPAARERIPAAGLSSLHDLETED